MGTKGLVAGLLLALIVLAAPSAASAGVDVTIDVADREVRPSSAPVMPKTGSDSLPVIAVACAITALGAAMLHSSRQKPRVDRGGDR